MINQDTKAATFSNYLRIKFLLAHESHPILDPVTPGISLVDTALRSWLKMLRY
jgi:hypothetical protein